MSEQKKNEMDYLILKERKERYINYILIILLLILLVFLFIYVYGTKPNNSEEIAYTDVSSNKKVDDSGFIRFIYDGFNHNNPPSKKNYEIDFVSCNNAKGSWDNNKWQLNLSGIVDKVSCSLFFKKKENVIAYKSVKKKTTIKKKEVKVNDNDNYEYLMNNIEDEVINNIEEVEEEKKNDTNLQEPEAVKEVIIFDYDKCEDKKDCDYVVSMDSNKEIRLNPILKINKTEDEEFTYELLKGKDAINLYNNIVCSKNIAYDEAYIKVSRKEDLNIYTIIKVIVEAQRFNTRIYSINRYNNTIDKIELNTKIDAFMNNMMNLKKRLHIFNNNEEINNYNKYVGTGMKFKFVINNKVYDELDVVVLGDVNGDGLCDLDDYELVYKHINNQISLEGPYLLAADCNKDGVVNSYDYELIYRYLGNYINSFIV